MRSVPGIATSISCRVSGWLVACLALALAAASGGAVGGEAEAKPQFDIWEFQVNGNSRLGVERIEKAVYGFLGEGKTIDDVEQARAALEKAYRDSGYATTLVSIPEQLVSRGVVELEVTEGHIERVRVTGAKYYAQGRILAQMPALTEGTVPNFKEVQQQLAAVNTSADRRVQPLLRPGKEPGTTDIELKVTDNLPFHATVELNNRYSASRAPNPGDYRISGTVRYDNLWQREHSISLAYLTSPGHRDEVEVTSAAYALPLFRPGETLSFYGVHSNSIADLTTSLAGSSVLGSGSIYGARLSEPLPALSKLSHTLTFGVDYKNLNESLRLNDGTNLPTPLVYWFASAQYAASRPDDAGVTSFGSTFGLSFRGLRDNQDQFAAKRFKGSSNFAVLRWNVQRMQELPAKFSMTARGDGQFASLPLPSSEAFAGGGADSVRGYPEAAQIGDHGIRGMLEARTPNVLAALIKGDLPGDLRLLAFVEGAHMRTLDPLPGQLSRVTLASAGLGLRLYSRRGVALQADLAHRLKNGLITDTHGSLAKGGNRLHFSLSYQL